VVASERRRASAPLAPGWGVRLSLVLLFLALFFFVCLAILPRLGVTAG